MTGPRGRRRETARFVRPCHGLVIGCAALLVLATTGAAIADSYLRARPVDMRHRTESLSRKVQDVLLTHQIPVESIRVATAVQRSDSEALWSHVEFDINVPPALNPEGLETDLRRSMANENVRVDHSPRLETGQRHLLLQLAGREFAVIRLQDAPQDSMQDWGAATRDVADRVARALNQGLRPVDSFYRAAPELRDDRNARWTFTRMHARLPENVTVDALVKRVERAAPSHGISAWATDGDGDGVQRISVAYAGAECVEILLTESDPPAEVRTTRVQRTGDPAPAAPEPIVEARLRREPLMPHDFPLDSPVQVEPLLPVPDRPAHAGPPRLAIIVDDGGWGGSTTEQMLALDPKLTLAIIPGTPAGTETAIAARKLGFEIMIHMPMESFNSRINVAHKKLPEFLTLDLHDAQVRAAFERAYEDIPYAVGVNNHVGGKYTSNARAMRVFLREVQKKNLYFVDSVTTSKTQAYAVAQELRIPSAANQVFLDNEADTEYIRDQFKALIVRAKRQGHTIAICHFRPKTVPVLAEMLPKIRAAGIELVHMSELLE